MNTFQLPSSILSLKNQLQVANAMGLRNIPHSFREYCGDVLLESVSFGRGETTYDPYTANSEIIDSGQNQFFYKHRSEMLTVLPKERELSLWERILPYPWGFLKGLHKKGMPFDFARPRGFQQEWEQFASLLDEVETLLSGSEISALYLSGNGYTASLLMRFLRKKCVGIASDSIAVSLQRRQANGGLNPSDLYELWGTSACFFPLKMNTLLNDCLSLKEINFDLKQALQSSNNLVRYRIPTLEDGVIEMGL